MPSPMIVLVSKQDSRVAWRSNYRLRAGRLPNLEIVLDDQLVSRQHAELLATDDGWIVRDLGSANGTFLNGVRIGRTGQRVRSGDQIEIGRTAVVVETVQEAPVERIRTGGQIVRLESTARGFWDEAGRDPVPTAPDQIRLQGTFLRLLRNVCQISHTTSIDPGLRMILKDVAKVFDAQRCGAFLLDALSGELVVRCMAVPDGSMKESDTLSKTLAKRAHRAARSMLFQDCDDTHDLEAVDSVKRGKMSSIICAVLPSAGGCCGILHLDRSSYQEPFTKADLDLADAVAAAVSLGIDRWQLAERHQDLLVQTVTALAQAVEMRDRYTGNHTHRVTTYALLIADELNLPAEQRQLLKVATPLHDIGKIAVDDSILRKAGALTPDEYDVMKGHVASGVNIIQMIPNLRWALPVVRSHHERWDGTGYPDGLVGTDIPLAARIVAVADAFDAMTSDRSYRKGLAPDAAFAELASKAGTHFDPNCVNAFDRARSKVESILGQETTLRQASMDVTETWTNRDLTSLLAQTVGPGDKMPKYEDETLRVA